MKAKRLFGTDGIRGAAGEFPLDEGTVARVGAAIAHVLGAPQRRPKILIGRDTRESGAWIEETLARSIMSGGGAASAAGVITTAGIACLTKARGFDAGVMISASHNPFRDNGIKVFSKDGYKLPDSEEARIEKHVLDDEETPGAGGGATWSEAATDLMASYRDHLLSAVAGARLEGMKVVLDCANGASHQVGPDVFRALGAAVVVLSDTPDGTNINSGCGSLHPEAMCDAVLMSGAQMGCAFDGDADRCILADEKGQVCDGDFILYRAALALKESGRLAGDLVVATVMSNLWLERALKREGIRMLRAPVGDKYVLEEMLRSGSRLGGEQSGHVIFLDHATTGDGVLTALMTAAALHRAERPLSSWRSQVAPCPQILINVRVSSRPPLEEHKVIGAKAAEIRTRLGETGRLLLRYSGTEPLARVMIEAEDADQVGALAREMADVITDEIGER